MSVKVEYNNINNNIMSTLCDLAFKYKSDKCPQIYHFYTPIYHNILRNKNIKKMLEIGIGNNPLMKPIAGEKYIPGASLFMWRDYFEDATIYSCDILEEVLFQEDRIKTFQCDQSSPFELDIMMKNIGICDFIIDDGSHIPQHQYISIITLWKYLNTGGIYIIEDIFPKHFDYILNNLTFTDYTFKCYKDEKNPNNQGFIFFEKNN